MTDPEERDTPVQADGSTPDGGSSRGGAASRGRRGMSAGQVLLVLVVGLTLAVLLGAGDLVKAGEAIAPEPWRTVVLGVAKPLRRTACFLSLDRPRRWLDSLRGYPYGAPAASTETTTTTRQTPSSSTSLTAGTSPTTRTTTMGATATALPSTTSATPTTVKPTTSTLPTPSAAEPLRVWVGGESMVEQVGDALINRSDSIKAMKVKMQFKISSGLCRPDYYDWPAVMKEVMATYDPQASVVMFGGNDMQGLVENGKALAAWSPEWTTAYGRRVGRVIEILSANGGRVYWVAPPPMRAEQDNRWAFDLDKIYRDVCSRYPQATYVDAWKLFSDEDGNYAAYLKDDSGRSRLVREPDGIHFTLAGGDRVATEILKELRKRWVLKES